MGIFDSLEKTHNKLHQLLYNLAVPYSFYNILESEFNRQNTSIGKRVAVLDIDSKEGMHYTLQSMKIVGLPAFGIDTMVDVEIEQAKEGFLEKVKNAYLSEDENSIWEIVWKFPSASSAWVQKLKLITPEETNQLQRIALAGFNDKNNSKIILERFKPPKQVGDYGNRKEDAQAIHDCFKSWADNGFYENMK